VEQNTNRNLAIDPANEEDILGYILDLEGVWSYLTPTSDTLVRPRLRFQHYPDNKEIQRSEQFLDLRTRNQFTERSRWDVCGATTRGATPSMPSSARRSSTTWIPRIRTWKIRPTMGMRASFSPTKPARGWSSGRASATSSRS
jgi:hypothetical protein